MKYVPPYGMEATPDAPYINGNPATGTMGSIPPAASIEYPQREIVKIITEAGLTPDNADLEQLMKSMKRVDVFNVWKAAVNTGNANNWAAAIPTLPTMPPPQGCTIWFKPVYDSIIGGTLLSVNGSAFAPVLHIGGREVTKGDFIGDSWILLFYSGTHWQIVAGASSSIASGQLPLLQSNVNWYVNGATGDDATYDGTSPTVLSATVGPFKTINHAALNVLKYNMNFFNQFIYIANGTYVETVNPQELNGTGWVYFIGNENTPGAVSIMAPPAVPLACALIQSSGQYSYNGLRFSTGPGQLDGVAISGGTAALSNLQFGPCARYHISSEYSGNTVLRSGAAVGGGGPGMIIEGGAHAQAHLCSTLGGNMVVPGAYPTLMPSLTFTGAVTFSVAFALATHLSGVYVFYNAINSGYAASGYKYAVQANGIMDTVGHGAGYFPGDTPGYAITGGQFIS